MAGPEEVMRLCLLAEQIMQDYEVEPYRDGRCLFQCSNRAGKLSDQWQVVFKAEVGGKTCVSVPQSYPLCEIEPVIEYTASQVALMRWAMEQPDRDRAER